MDFQYTNPVTAEFVFIAIASRRTGPFLKKFSWTNWFCLAGLMKVLARAPSSGTPWEYMQVHWFPYDNHPRE